MKQVLFRFSLRRIVWQTALAMLTGMTLSVVGILLYADESAMEALTQARAEAPALFAMLGFGGSASLTLHMASTLYGLLLPSLLILYSTGCMARLVSGMIESGEAAHFLASPHPRRAFVWTLYAVLAVGLIAIVLAIMTAAMLAAAVTVMPGKLQLAGFGAMNAGLFSLAMLCAGHAAQISCRVDVRRMARNRVLVVQTVFLLLWVVSRGKGAQAYLAYVTPGSLFDPEGLVMLRDAALIKAAVLPAAALVLSVLGCRAFTRRDLPL